MYSWDRIKSDGLETKQAMKIGIHYLKYIFSPYPLFALIGVWNYRFCISGAEHKQKIKLRLPSLTRGFSSLHSQNGGSGEGQQLDSSTVKINNHHFHKGL